MILMIFKKAVNFYQKIHYMIFRLDRSYYILSLINLFSFRKEKTDFFIGNDPRI